MAGETNFTTVEANLTGNVTGNLTGNVTGNVTGNLTGNVSGQVLVAAPTAYNGGVGNTAISPSIGAASLTKGTAGIDYTLAVPGTANIGKRIKVYSTGAYAHVVTVTGLLGGTTLTFAAAAGAGFTLLAVSATAWAVEALNGVTQTA